MNLISLYLFAFMIIMLSFIMNYTHLLMSLLCLEGMTLIMVMYIPMSLSMMNTPIHQLSLLLLTFSACEASLGLSMIVKLSRIYGSDLLSTSAINSC